MARYIDHINLPTPHPAHPKAELLSSLTKLTTSCPPQERYGHHSCHGLYSGPTSIAYLFYTLSNSHPNLVIGNENPSHWARAYLAGTRPKSDVTPTRCGIANETLSYLAVSAAFMQHQPYVQKFLDHLPALIDDDSGEASNEWLYGRAGTLYLLRLIQKASSASNPTPVAEAITAVIDKILSEGPPWYWHGKEYLGAVHGTVGILTQIILCSPPQALRLTGLLEGLLDTQSPETGNWPSSVGSSSAEKLVQFCHGAPGFVVSLLAIEAQLAQLPNTPETLLIKLHAAIERGRECIWQRGLLTKQPSLCHGVVGNTVALEGERRDLFMRWAQEGVIEQGLREGWYVEGDDPWGLFCGEAGRAWGWAMMVEGQGWGVRQLGMIGYSDV